MDGGGGEQQSEWKTGRGNGEKQEAQTAFKDECFSVALLCSQVVAVHM